MKIYKMLKVVSNTTPIISLLKCLVSLEVKSDHVYMYLLENAPFNKGQTKVYAGVAGNLVAYACKLSF
jgi:hypothetical protein